MKKLYSIDAENAQLHISKGNSKIGKGIWAISFLPGNKDHMVYIGKNVLLTDIPGTCSKYCDGCAKDGACYAWRDLKLHHNVTVKAWAENTILLRSGQLFEKLDEFITQKNKDYYVSKGVKDRKIITFRINVSGEVESLAQFEAWNNLALHHPEVNFGIYTKNFDDLDKFMKKNGKIADNFIINISEWHGVAKEFLTKYPNQFNVFEYDDTNRKDCDLDNVEKERLSKTVHCPAVTKTGHHAKTKDGRDVTCDMCRRCYTKGHTYTAVYSH
ncbi:MAG: hypothetical protein KBT06_04360 [Prevotellaceae bacterium]|nr:hypothetical protein [Candidatus Colivivens equi]